MQVFLSHTHQDADLAKQVAAVLRADGLKVWNVANEILPGDNWAEKTGQALRESEAMVVLLTPEALESPYVRWEIEYALGAASYSHRLIPVIVGQPENLPEEKLPWILKRLNMVALPEGDRNAADLQQIAEALQAIH